ncbi:TetR family transcriptional regulator [Lentzea atacamensis]|uniref:TetR family transcriptional regulator n=2 Tax=Lentzea TaxID=165301 RepID=A0A316HRT3_9PSEU|nr:TetR/AcrR family transcriptional regulator [Lentzea atacamensis]PWK82683.1 TetR family transcriptional regulator [Lentzea atacamensis]RAS63040.1 TetR family transcriptional regulator [Lentzea atacamensis]
MRTRRAEYSESTRQALVDSAVDLFTKRGYAGTSLDEVVKRARVTKGALYHHFSGKQALFEAAFAQVETQAIESLTAVVTADGDAWETAVAGLRAYVRKCLDPEYQRIIIHEAPVVMGWERWREAEEHFSFGLLRTAVQLLVDAGEIEEAPVEIMARLLFGALSAGASTIASSSDPKRTGREVERAILRVLEGLRKK